MADPTDEALVARCQQGSDEAFAELVRRYQARVHGLIARTLGDAARADDAAQEVFLRVYRGLPYFRGAAKLSTWVYRITMNVCFEQRVVPTRIEVPASEPGDDRHAPRELATIDGSFNALELRDRLGKALARLPPNYRALVAAHYLRDVRYEDLAETFDLPLGTVKTQLHRAKRELRRLLETELA
jgi:RNA polymerase sigma-70 factor (ECF subfamily)